MTQDVKTVADSFKSAHANLFSGKDHISVGYGLDPARQGPVGVIVYVLEDDDKARWELLSEVRSSLPKTWEGVPVYVDGRTFPYAQR